MGYLTLTRREGEQIRMTIDPGVDIEKLISHLLRDGITIHVGAIEGNRASIAIDAPRELRVVREELT